MPYAVGAAGFVAALLLFASGAAAQNLFVSCMGDSGIFEIAPNGTESFFAGGVGIAPAGLAFDSSGDLFVASVGSGEISEFINHNGVLSTTPVVFASGLDEPFGLAFNSAGNLFVSEYGNGVIAEITPTGTVSTFAQGPDGAEGLTFFGTELFVANQIKDTVSEISPSGTITAFASGFSAPSGLAIGGAGLFVSNQQGNTIDEILLTSKRGLTYASGLDEPNGIVFNGNVLYEADTESGEINEFIPTNRLPIGTTIVEKNLVSGLDEPVGLAFQPAPEPPVWALLAAGATALLARCRRAK